MSLERFSRKLDVLENFVVHLEELRRRLFVWFIAFLFAAVVSYFFSSFLLEILTRPLRQFQDVKLFFQAPYEAFLVRVKIAALTGVIFSSPVFFTLTTVLVNRKSGKISS